MRPCRWCGALPRWRALAAIAGCISWGAAGLGSPEPTTSLLLAPSRRRGFVRTAPGRGCSGSALVPRRHLPPARTPCPSTWQRLPVLASLELARASPPLQSPCAARGFASSAGCPAPWRGSRLLDCASPWRLNWLLPLPLTTRPSPWSAKPLTSCATSGWHSSWSPLTASGCALPRRLVRVPQPLLAGLPWRSRLGLLQPRRSGHCAVLHGCGGAPLPRGAAACLGPRRACRRRLALFRAAWAVHVTPPPLHARWPPWKSRSVSVSLLSVPSPVPPFSSSSLPPLPRGAACCSASPARPPDPPGSGAVSAN